MGKFKKISRSKNDKVEYQILIEFVDGYGCSANTDAGIEYYDKKIATENWDEFVNFVKHLYICDRLSTYSNINLHDIKNHCCYTSNNFVKCGECDKHMFKYINPIEDENCLHKKRPKTNVKDLNICGVKFNLVQNETVTVPMKMIFDKKDIDDINSQFRKILQQDKYSKYDIDAVLVKSSSLEFGDL